jgi:short-subunit dehydrogenase
MSAPLPAIMVLGTSGLIGEAVANLLAGDGFAVTPVARRFTAAQRTAFADMAVETPIVDLGVDDLARLISDSKADLVVNCIGVLQDSVQRGRA